MRDEIYKRLPGLDFVRFIAGIGIVFHHYQQLTGLSFGNGNLNFWGGQFNFGYLVEFFFVLSGFLQHRNIEKIRKKESTFKDFIIRKIIRLIPMLAISTIVMTVLMFIYHRIIGQIWMGMEIGVWDLLVNIAGLSTGWGMDVTVINSPTWYISILLLCYVVFYVMIWVSERIGTDDVYLSIIMVICSIGLNRSEVDSLFLNPYSTRGMYSFFAGVILGTATSRALTGKRTVVMAILTDVILTLMIIFRFSYISDGLGYILACLYFPMIIIIFSYSKVSGLFEHNLWKIIGGMTYDLYVWHIPILVLLNIIEFVMIKGQIQRSFLTMAGYTILSIIVSTVIYFELHMRIEKHLIRCYEKNYEQ